MALALFDLDDTLITGNCETDWLRYLIEHGHYDSGGDFDVQITEFDRQYAAGSGDIDDYISFVLRPLTLHPLEALLEWRSAWFESSGKAMITARARQRLQQHRAAGDRLLIISASNQFCVQPFAQALGVDHYLCSIPEQIDGRYTGGIMPPACYGVAKITHLNHWLAGRDYSLRGSYFYSDSRNDIPLLEWVDNPVAVNADTHLTQVAKDRGWTRLDLS